MNAKQKTKATPQQQQATPQQQHNNNTATSGQGGGVESKNTNEEEDLTRMTFSEWLNHIGFSKYKDGFDMVEMNGPAIDILQYEKSQFQQLILVQKCGVSIVSKDYVRLSKAFDSLKAANKAKNSGLYLILFDLI